MFKKRTSIANLSDDLVAAVGARNECHTADALSAVIRDIDRRGLLTEFALRLRRQIASFQDETSFVTPYDVKEFLRRM